MKAIILAAGKGTRLKPLTDTTPKPLLPILQKPILEHIIESLPNQITELVIIVGYKADMIRAHFGDSFCNRRVSYIEQTEQLGTGHAALLAKPILKDNERFMFLFADDLHDKKSIEQCLGFNLGMLVTEVSDPRRFGVVTVNKQNIVTHIDEKPDFPKSNLVNIGVYVLDTKIFSYQQPPSKTGEYYLTDMISALSKDYPIHAVKTDFWHPIGYPQDLLSAEQVLRERNNKDKGQQN